MCSVLVVDDNEMLRILLERMLGKLGYRVSTAADATEALAVFDNAKNQQTPVKILITDLSLSQDMDGNDLAEALRQKDKNLKTVAMSGYTHDPVIEHYRECGFHAALRKPFRFNELRAVFEALAGQESSS